MDEACDGERLGNEGTMAPSPGTITRLLVDWRDGGKTALDGLIPLVRRELPGLGILPRPGCSSFFL